MSKEYVYDVVRIDSEHSSTVEDSTDDLEQAKATARRLQEADDTRPYEVWECDPDSDAVNVLWREGWS